VKGKPRRRRASAGPVPVFGRCLLADNYGVPPPSGFYWNHGVRRKWRENPLGSISCWQNIDNTLVSRAARCSFFFAWNPKILVSNNLGGDDRREPAQNLEPLGLTRKILRNKDLAVATKKRLRLSAGEMNGCGGCGRQGQMSQGRKESCGNSDSFPFWEVATLSGQSRRLLSPYRGATGSRALPGLQRLRGHSRSGPC
jgi:hypothetical protein